MNAKGGKRIEITAHGDPKPRYLDLFSDTDPEGGPLIHPRNFINLPPPPSALDSIWERIWARLKEMW